MGKCLVSARRNNQQNLSILGSDQKWIKFVTWAAVYLFPWNDTVSYYGIVMIIVCEVYNY